MKGYIRNKGKDKNTWQIQVYLGIGMDGKYRRHFKTVHGRKSDAQNRLNELLVNLEKGNYSPTGHITVSDHLQNWLEGYVKTNCSQRTLDGYQSIIETHLIPALGHLH